MYPNPYDRHFPSYARPFASATQGAMTRVYQWMALGLGVTGATAMVLQNYQSQLLPLFMGPLMWVLLLGSMGLSIALQGWAARMSAPTAFALFFLYSFVMGVSLTPIFWIYKAGSIGAAFIVTGGMFAAMTVWGYVTKRDLSSVGSFAIMGAWGLLIASIVNMVFFPASGMLYWLTTYAGVVIFTLLTAYQTQNIKRMMEMNGGSQPAQLAIQGAVILYVSFVNLFLYILRILGSRRD